MPTNTKKKHKWRAIQTFLSANLCNLGTSSANRALVLRISAFIATTAARFLSCCALSDFYKQNQPTRITQRNRFKNQRWIQSDTSSAASMSDSTEA